MCPFRTHCVIEVFPRGRGVMIAHRIDKIAAIAHSWVQYDVMTIAMMRSYAVMN